MQQPEVHMQDAQQHQEQQQQQGARDTIIVQPGDATKQHAAHAELQKLTHALREAEQRASAAELAVVTVQRTHTEAVEQSARLQASCILPCTALPCPASHPCIVMFLLYMFGSEGQVLAWAKLPWLGCEDLADAVTRHLYDPLAQIFLHWL